MSKTNILIKRFLDSIVSFLVLIVCFPLLIILFVIANISTKENGFYTNTRIGKQGRPFVMWKIRSMKSYPAINTSVTTQCDPRITPFGRFLRQTKLDELPQLWNVLKGDMSLVGPRPDVPGFADKLEGDNRKILTVRPGITGLATLSFRNEEILLSKQKNPEKYNLEVIWPEKVRLNKYYIEHYSLWLDFKILFKTVFGGKISI